MTGGSAGSGGTTAGAGGAAAGEGREGGRAADGGGAGDAASGGPGTPCVRDTDCEPVGECYATVCEAGSCVGTPLARGSACANDFCNGFGRCLPCLDDAPSTGQDTGCPETSPLCAETASEPACLGCQRDPDCDDGSECTIDHCIDSACEHTSLALGELCEGGVCDGREGEGSCVPCVDSASAGVDSGCTTDQPTCDTTRSPPACSGCRTPADCDDSNDCTVDGCSAGACEHTALASGTPCARGYCNGIPGAELCIALQCLTDADCDDRAACTTEVCDANLCRYTADHDACADSGDVCRPNRCAVGTGCRQLDLARAVELLANGDFEAGNDGWTELSATYSHVIFLEDYVPSLRAHTPPFVAWLGGGQGMLDETNSVSQLVTVPPGAVRLELSFFYLIWTEEGLPPNHNELRVTLRSPDTPPADGLLATFHNQDQTPVWTRFTTTLDATDLAGSELTLAFSGTGIDGFTHFFVDSVSLIATACD